MTATARASGVAISESSALPAGPSGSAGSEHAGGTAGAARTTNTAVGTLARIVAVPAKPALPAGSGVTEQPSAPPAGPAITAVTGGGPVHAIHVVVAAGHAAGSALPAGPAGSPPPGRAAGSARPAANPVEAHRAGSSRAAGPADPAVSEPPSARPAGTTGRAGPAGPAHPTVADQARSAAGPAGDPGCGLRKAVAAIAVQEPAGPAVWIRRGPGGAIADQWTPQQRLGRCIDHTQHCVFEGLQRRGAGRLRGRVGSARTIDCLDELCLKCIRLQANRLVGLPIAGEQRRHSRRDLIGSSGQHPGGRDRRGQVGRAQRRGDSFQIGRRRCQQFWRHQKV